MRVSGFGWLLYVLQNRMKKKAFIRIVPQNKIASILNKVIAIGLLLATG